MCLTQTVVPIRKPVAVGIFAIIAGRTKVDIIMSRSWHQFRSLREAVALSIGFVNCSHVLVIIAFLEMQR